MGHCLSKRARESAADTVEEVVGERSFFGARPRVVGRPSVRETGEGGGDGEDGFFFSWGDDGCCCC